MELLERYKDAEDAYKKGIKTIVGFGRCHWLLGQLLKKQKRYKEAEYHFERTMNCEHRPWHMKPYLQYATLLIKLRKFEKALKLLEQCLEYVDYSSYKQCAEVYFMLGRTYHHFHDKGMYIYTHTYRLHKYINIKY